MQYLLSVLPVLACSLGMGAMIWFVMRAGREPTPANTFEIPTRRQEEHMVASDRPLATLPTQQPSLLKTIWDCIQMCLNWRVLVGLVAVAALIWAFTPNLFVAALPTLLILVCPLSMGIMFLSMSRRRQSSSPKDNPACAACQTSVPAEPHEAFAQPDTSRSPVSPRSESVV